MSFDIMGFESKVVIEEEPTFFKFLQKQGVQNLVKSVIGTVLLKMPKKMVDFSIFRNTIYSLWEGSATQSDFQRQ